MVLLKSNDKLKLGEKAPDFSLTGTDDKTYSLTDFNKKALLIVFMCNHCPYVIPKLQTLIDLQEEFKQHLDIIGINPNTANPNYEDDSFENMKTTVIEQKINFPYLNDNTQNIARSYGATCTPDVFLFKNKQLFYHGRIDDLPGTQGTPTRNDLKDAIHSLLNNRSIDFKPIPSMGCSIKWV